MRGQETAKIPLFGAVASVRGSVVDIRFDEHSPPIYSLLRAGKDGQVAIEVLSQLDAHRVRGIALIPTQGSLGAWRWKTRGGPLKMPVGKGIPRGESGVQRAWKGRFSLEKRSSLF